MEEVPSYESQGTLTKPETKERKGKLQKVLGKISKVAGSDMSTLK